ncbi:MAG TPA: hypothetical protein VN744_12570 [Casimicrobiaceae bacterium]|nr:hypothetical protein [Casimicrobiaceae bacterium]
MALLGTAAMLLWYDIIPDQVAEHDDWHTRQHFPERVGIPGFIRAQRWVSSSPGARYFVVYEVSGIDVLSSAPYLERLNHPTAWTSRVMPAFRGMVRGFCRLDARYGSVLGTTALTLRYSAATGRGDRLREWLHADLLPDLMQRKGFTSAFMLRSEREPEMTAEQRIRGRDASVDRVLLVTGYRPELMTNLAEKELDASSLEANGASSGTIAGIYQLACIAGAPS